MSQNWQGSERARRAPVDLTQPFTEPEKVPDATEPALTVVAPEPELVTEPEPSAAGSLAAPLVRGRRSAAILRKENVDDQLPPTAGWQAFLRAASFGMIKPKAGAAELARRRDISAIQRIFSRPMNIMLAQPLGGVGKTTCSIGLGSTFGIHSALQTLVWDNNETMGTLGVRTNSNDSHSTVWDLLRELESFETVQARKGELSYYTRHQGNNGFHVLVSDEDPDRMKSIGVNEFNRLMAVLSRFYDTLIIDTGNNTRSENWLAAAEVADQLVIPTSLKRNSVVSALRMIEQLESMSAVSGDPRYQSLVDNAVVLVTDGTGANASPEERAQFRKTLEDTVRVVIDIPYDPKLDEGDIIDWQLVKDPTRRAFERAAAEISDRLLTIDNTTITR